MIKTLADDADDTDWAGLELHIPLSSWRDQWPTSQGVLPITLPTRQ